MTSIRQTFECGLAAFILSCITNHQESQRCRSLIASTSISYAILYLVLSTFVGQRQSEVQQQSASSNTSNGDTSCTSTSSIDLAERKSRILSTLNAIVLTFGSVLCFTEWPYDPIAEGWSGTHGIWSHPASFASLFLGYLQFDLIWILYHRRDYSDSSAAIHHVLFILMTHYVLSGVYFKKAFAWLSFTELSTPFLNARWYYAASGQKETTAYMYSSLMFALTFLLTRVLGYGLGLLDVCIHYNEWKSVGVGLHLVFAGLVLGYVLNLFWAIKIIKAVQRVVMKKSGKSKKA